MMEQLSNVLNLVVEKPSSNYTVNTKSIKFWKEDDWNIPYSNRKAPPMVLFDIMAEGKLSDETIKSYHEDGITSLNMDYYERRVVSLDEISIDLTQSSRVLVVDHSHKADIQGSFLANGWNYDCSPPMLYILPDIKLSEIRASDPNTKIKYGIVTCYHRFSAAKGLDMTHILADIYEYNNHAALEIWSARSNPVPVPTLKPSKEDVEKKWTSFVKERKFHTVDESIFDEFVYLHNFGGGNSSTGAPTGGFDPRTLASLKKKFLLPQSVSTGDERILIVEQGRKVESKDARHLKNVCKTHKILNRDENGFSTDDPRCSGLFRDFMNRTAAGKTIYVHLYVNANEAKSGLTAARKKLLEGYNSKMKEFSETIFYTNKAAGLYGNNVDMKVEVDNITKNLPFKFNGFLPQLLTKKNDRIETFLVDENGNEFKNAVYSK